MIFLIGIFGTLSIFIIGYLMLNVFSWKENLSFYEKILLSPALFFLMPLITYIVNLLFNGCIFSNGFYFYIYAAIYFIIITFFSFSRIKKDLLYLKEMLNKLIINLDSKKVAFFISLIVIISLNIYFSIRPLIIAPLLAERHDFFRHIMYARQLLNGFIRTHWCYDIAPNLQPFLMHSAIAVLKRIFNFHIFDTVFILVLFQAILLPVAVALLGYKIGNKLWFSLLSTFFICINGGNEFIWRESWVLNIAQQQAFPGLFMRQMSITLFPFFIYSIIRIFEERDNKFFKIYSSIILAILGTIHAHVFYFSIVFIVIMIVLNFKKKKLIKNLLFILFIGVSVSLLYYIPLFLDLLTKNLLVWQQSDERWTVLLNIKRFLNFFGVVGIISVPSIFLLPKIKYKKIFISIFIALTIIFLFTFIVDLMTGEQDPIMPFRQHRFSFVLYIFLSIMVLLFINFLKTIQRRHILVICVFLILINIAITTKAILENSDVWTYEISAISGIRYEYLFRNNENAVDKLLKVANKKDIVSIPPEISKIFVMYSGLDVVYAPWLHELYEENIPQLQLERENDIKTIYNIDTEGMILKKLFKKYKVKYFLVFEEDRKKFDSINFLEVIDKGKWLDNKNLLIYKVFI